MSTRSSITAKLSTGRFASIYCHFDGYLENNGRILLNHYNTQEKVDALLALGDLSVLDASTECPDGHAFGSAIKGHCVAYGRDRGEANTQANEGATASEALYRNRQQFNYLWNGESWAVDGKSLADAVAALNR